MIFVQDGPKVLVDISFHVKSGERVGIGETQYRIPSQSANWQTVGRTGSGKVRTER